MQGRYRDRSAIASFVVAVILFPDREDSSAVRIESGIPVALIGHSEVAFVHF